MNVLITGATGFVGQQLISYLNQDKSLELICVVRDEEKAKTLLGYNIKCVKLDKVSLLDKVDIVVHLASFLTSRDDKEVISDLINSNVVFGVKLMDALQKHKNIKFINIGTFAEYRSDASKPDCAYLYAATKRAFRPFLDYYANKLRWDYITLIPYTIYGGVNNQKKLIDYVKDSIDSQLPILMSPGLQVSDFVHVKDVVSCITFFIRNTQKWQGKRGEEYHLGSGRGTTVRELASLFEKYTNKKCNIEWGGRPYRERDVMHAVAPIGKLIDLGWTPQISLEEGIKEYL